ncbi:hypothetical protein HMPREF1544_06695 [Mucor circinelloides 1006PhL]|uniref:Uncharacterized protein n=1 Tax=Mucor circinelloides f. circinelloides (strain 1006PhL) TaxID=1220926 RepID=S2JUQ7_MUCC1|nr:hypothetical protein HMPREF1544_06695 [Mucor circinelloides 1006PhL]
MLATARSMMTMLVLILATLSLVSASCRETKSGDRFSEFCCSCTNKGWFGECLTTHNSACRENSKFTGEHSCPKGEWGCYTDHETIFH